MVNIRWLLIDVINKDSNSVSLFFSKNMVNKIKTLNQDKNSQRSTENQFCN